MKGSSRTATVASASAEVFADAMATAVAIGSRVNAALERHSGASDEPECHRRASGSGPGQDTM